MIEPISRSLRRTLSVTPQHSPRALQHHPADHRFDSLVLVSLAPICRVRSGTTLKVHSGDLHITKAGAASSGLDIRGLVTARNHHTPDSNFASVRIG